MNKYVTLHKYKDGCMHCFSVEPYLPEPYTPKSTGYQATPKPDEKWESSNDVDPNFLTQRLGPVQISANRHTNLVRVPTDEVRTLSSTGKLIHTLVLWLFLVDCLL